MRNLQDLFMLQSAPFSSNLRPLIISLLLLGLVTVVVAGLILSANVQANHRPTNTRRGILYFWNKNVNNHYYCSKTGNILGVLSLKYRQFLTNNISKILF